MPVLCFDQHHLLEHHNFQNVATSFCKEAAGYVLGNKNLSLPLADPANQSCRRNILVTRKLFKPSHKRLVMLRLKLKNTSKCCDLLLFWCSILEGDFDFG